MSASFDMLVSYKSNPYVHSSNNDEVDGSVLKINATKDNGEELRLEDPDDPVVLAVDMSSIFDDDSTWKDMEKFESVNGAFMIARDFNISLNAIIVEIKLKSIKVCTTYGRSRVEDSRPDNLPVAFENQILRITIINENISEPMKPIVITVLCDVGLPIHEYRIAEVDLRYFDKTSGTWNQSDGLKANAAKGKSVGFKSNFFGTFSANALFIPPQPINFAEIFLNFHERLRSTPHFLVWSNLPLVDSLPDARYSYNMIFYTDIRSAKYFTSTVYLELKGKQGRTGIRILQDGQRENFGRGTSSYFTMKTKEHLGKLLELKLWHDNSGKYAKWLLIIIRSQSSLISHLYTNYRYMFFCGKWLSVEHDDGKTWRKLRPMALDIISGNDMFNELSKRNLFDDHLWLSMSMRPTYSSFTRVQRLWTLAALLFLSMITSAMWYETGDQSDGSGIKIGPLKLNYKMVYVGFMSSVICVFPSLIIMHMFKNRRVRSCKLSKRKKIEKHKDGRTFQNIDNLTELESIHSENLDTISNDKDNCIAGYKGAQIGYKVSDENTNCIPNVGFTGDSFYAKILNSTQTTLCPVTTNETINYKTDDKTRNFKTYPCNKSVNENVNYQTHLFKKTEQEPHSLQFHHNHVLNNTAYTETNSEKEFETFNLLAPNKVENERENYEGYKCNVPMKNVDNVQLYHNMKHEDDKDVVKCNEAWVDKEKKPTCCVQKENSFFTFLYTLEWGPEKTGEWMMAFFFGAIENVLVIEPIKISTFLVKYLPQELRSFIKCDCGNVMVVVFALLISCFFKSVALKYFGDSFDKADNSIRSEDTTSYVPADDGNSLIITLSLSINIIPPSLMEFPGGKEEDNEMLELKKKLLLDRRLNEKIKSWMYQFLYILVLGIICSHNIITASYYQNKELAETLSPTTKLLERADIWKWLESQLLNATFPKWYYNDMVRPAYVQRFTQNTYNLKLGPVRIRQVRTKVLYLDKVVILKFSLKKKMHDNIFMNIINRCVFQRSCKINYFMLDAVGTCPQKYSLDTEETNNFCVDWVTFNETCFDENEETDYSFEYTDDSKTKSMPYSGIFATYSGGGYVVDLGPKQSLALSYIQKLKEGNWINENTRAVFVETLTYNANTRAFTHARVVIETPEIGGVFLTTYVWSANLYPYITSLDFVVLICQISFILIIFIRFILFLVMVCKTKGRCCTSMMTWVRLLEIILAIGSITSYILRIDNTITAIETLFNNFEEVYTAMISLVMFLVIIELLQPLTFNYYFYLMRTSLAVAGKDLFGMFVWIIIPMTAFAMLLYLHGGYLEESFRDLPNSFMTVLLFLIGMTFSNRTEVNHTFITIVYCSYTVLMSMVFISVFISILSIGYNDVKSENFKDEEPFDAELSDHLYFIISNFIRSFFPKRKPKFVEETIPRDLLLEKVHELEEKVWKLNLEEVRYHKKLTQEMLTIKPAPVKYLQCLISWDTNKTTLSYTNDNHVCVLEMTIPDQSTEEKIMISVSNGNKKSKNTFPFNVPENKRTPIFSIRKISKLHNQVAFRASLKTMPTNAVLIYNENAKKTHFGKFEISPQGGEYSICNKTTVIKFEPDCVTDDCSFTVKAIPFGISSMVEFMVSEDILKPMRITIPRYGGNSRDSTEMIVILKQGDNDWIKLNVLLDIQPDKFQFTLPISNVIK
ncbi:hypothetical protein KUTeg_022977, partial [Tegillarca granosa]